MRKGFDPRKPNRKAYRDFLNKLLQTIRRTNCKRQVVERLLKANLDKLDDNIAQVLRSWATANLSHVKPEEAQRIAEDIGNFSFLVQQFPLGSKDNHLEIAITGYEVAVTVFTRKAFPEQWATIQNNLGEAYRNRIRGDKLQNLEKAVEVLQDALRYTPDKFPEIRAAIQNNLGLAYRDQGQTEQAISVHNKALKFYSIQGLSAKWADTQNYLGNAYSDQGQIGEAEAMEAYENALKVCIPETEKWAEIKNNLAVEYCKKGQIDQAIASYQDNLTVYTRDKFPERWAVTQYNLGHAYSEGGQIDNAITSFQSALKVYTPTDFPMECVYSGGSLGHMTFAAGRWAQAIEGYGVAIEAVEQRREWASSDSRKQGILSDEIAVYANMVQACINIDHLEKAIEYVERSKTRNLVELLASRDLCPKGDFPKTILHELKRLRQEIAAEQRRIDTAGADGIGGGMKGDGHSQFPTNLPFSTESTDRARLNVLQQQLDDLITQQIQPIDPTFRLTQRVQPINFQQIQQLLPDDKTVLIEWYITGNNFLTFIITSQNRGITIWQSSLEDEQTLLNWTIEYLQSYAQPFKKHWQDNLKSNLNHLAEILHLEEILTHIPDTYDRVILIPHQFLHLFPLHALPLPNQKDKCLVDKFPRGVRYAPSCQLLQLTQRQSRSDFKRLFAIQDPEQNLSFANSVVETIHQYFQGNAQILVREAATKEALNNATNAEFLRLANCVLFSGHGIFNYESPLQSCLKLANNTRLTLGEIFSMNLSQCSLVTLSACETGLADPTSISDEYISLPSGFLFAGSPRVVCSLWEVSSISTTLLIREFYKNLFENLRTHQKLDVALAMNKAQKWLRELTSEQCEAILRDDIEPQVQEIIKQLPKKRRRYQASLDAAYKGIRDRQPHPFGNPYYWAAFTVTGV